MDVEPVTCSGDVVRLLAPFVVVPWSRAAVVVPTGKQILIGGGKGRRIQVTLASLRSGFPELVDTADYFTKIIEENTEELRGDMLTQAQVDRALGARVGANTRAIDRLTKQLKALRSYEAV